MTALKPKNLNHNQHLNKWLTPTWKTKGNTSYTYTHKNNNNYMVSWLRNRTQCTSNTQHFCRLHLKIAHIWTEKWHYNNKMSIISGIMKPFWWHFPKALSFEKRSITRQCLEEDRISKIPSTVLETLFMSNCAKFGRFPAIHSWDQFSRRNEEYIVWEMANFLYNFV